MFFMLQVKFYQEMIFFKDICTLGSYLIIQFENYHIYYNYCFLILLDFFLTEVKTKIIPNERCFNISFRRLKFRINPTLIDGTGFLENAVIDMGEIRGEGGCR